METYIPQDLKALCQWVAWWSVPGTGVPATLPNGRPTRPLEARPKPHKLPVNAATGGLAMANNPATWCTYAQACEAVQRFGVTGVGFVFAPDGPYTGIDLDDCRDLPTGEIAPWARRILDSVASYTEVSPSGKASQAGGLCRVVLDF
jgi:primase-polymerase (primpol)-like protein